MSGVHQMHSCYSAHILETKMIPKNVENRQQNLSRIIGEMWGLTSDEEKRKYYDEAEEKARKHRERYPHYRFNPSPSGSRAAKKLNSINVHKSADDIRRIREEHTRYKGPAKPSKRPRQKKAHSLEGRNPVKRAQTPILTPSLHCVSSQTSLGTQDLSAMAIPSELRRPSTSLGFSHFAKDATSFPLVLNQEDTITDYSIFNQLSAKTQLQSLQSLNPTMYSTPDFSSAFWTSPAEYQQHQPMAPMEAISPFTQSQETSYALADFPTFNMDPKPRLDLQGFVAQPSSGNDLQYVDFFAFASLEHHAFWDEQPDSLFRMI